MLATFAIVLMFNIFESKPFKFENFKTAEEAKIEIVAKPIKGFEGAKDFAPHHLFGAIRTTISKFQYHKDPIV